MFRATDVHWMGVHSSFTLIHGKHERRLPFAAKKKIIRRSNVSGPRCEMLTNGWCVVKRNVPASDADRRDFFAQSFHHSFNCLLTSFSRILISVKIRAGFSLVSNWRRLGLQLLRKAIRNKNRSFLPLRKSKRSAMYGERLPRVAGMTFAEQISPFDGDVTLESSTNVAFPWNGSFPGRRPGK